jgi:hypothetical protein
MDFNDFYQMLPSRTSTNATQYIHTLTTYKTEGIILKRKKEMFAKDFNYRLEISIQQFYLSSGGMIFLNNNES